MSESRELHGDGGDGRHYRGNRGNVVNSGDGDSSHGSTAVTVTELTVGLLFMHGLK